MYATKYACTSDPEDHIFNIHCSKNLISQRVKTPKMIMLYIQILITCNVRIVFYKLLILRGFYNSSDQDGYVWELRLAGQLQQRRKAKNDPQQAWRHKTVVKVGRALLSLQIRDYEMGH
jgi:hypothetical protein